MKRLTKGLLALVCAALLFTACQSDESITDLPSSQVEIVENPYALSEDNAIRQATILRNKTSGVETRSSSAEELKSEIKKTDFSVIIPASGRQRTNQQQIVPVYTINYADSKGTPDGFVVMVGDERISDNVLIFADAGAQMDLDSREDAEFIKDLIGGYLHQTISRNFENKEVPVKSRAAGTKIYTTSLLFDWHQYGDPYMRYTPYRDGDRTLPGCVAVAMGRIMAYHKWPHNGAYMRYPNATATQPQAVYVKYNSPDWNIIQESNTLAYIRNTQPSALDVMGNILAEIGYKLNTDYRTNEENKNQGRGSFAYTSDVPKVFTEMGYWTDGYGGYNFTKVERDIVTFNRPVYMAGRKPNGGGGHAYVVAGIAYNYHNPGDRFLCIRTGNGGDVSGEYHSVYYYNEACFSGVSMPEDYPYRYNCEIVTGITRSGKNGSTNATYRVSTYFTY